MTRQEFRGGDWKFPFVAYTTHKAGGKLPLIIQLHGAGERGNGEEELYLVDKHGFSNSDFIKRDDRDCMIVMPQCPANSFWAARVESILVFIDQLQAHFDIDPERIYLTGISMGGFGTWFTAMADPSRFAAIAPVCGGGMSWNAGVLSMPVLTYHGADDDVVPVFHTDSIVEKMRACGLDVTYHRIDGVRHDVWIHTYDEEMLMWLLSHKRA